jgi:hypothetical protein
VRKILGLILIGLGGFLLVLGLLTTLWVPGQVKKAPIDTDSVTRLSGTAAVVPSGDTNVDVRAVSNTKADSNKSDDDVVVYASYTCLVLDVPGPDCGKPGTGEDADPHVISVGQPDIFATDRATGVAVNSGKYLPQGTPKTEGLVNKFPFDTSKRDYEFWDGVLNDTVIVKYQGTEKVDGVETYKFQYVVDQEDATIASGVEGTYSMDKTMWIEPTTGQIVDQEQHDVRAVDGKNLLDVQLSFTDDQVKTNADDAGANASSLKLLTKTVPVVGFVGGVLLILLGIALVVLSRRRSNAGDHAKDAPADSVSLRKTNA